MISERILSLTSLYQLGVLALLSLVGLVLWPSHLAGICGGGGLMALNFWGLRYLMKRIMGDGSARVFWAMLLASKTVLVMALLALWMLVVGMDAFGVALGLSTLFFGIGLAVTHQALSPASSGAHIG